MYYINIFFMYSFLGFLFENGLNVVMNTNFNSGILYGPWTFIYGFAIFILMFLNKVLENVKVKKWVRVLLFYVGSVILMTLLEYTGGMLIEKLFHQVYWDYSNLKFNFGNYICLEVSLLWGVFATFMNYLIVPHLNKLAKKIPVYISVILIMLFVVDIIVTIVN